MILESEITAQDLRARELRHNAFTKGYDSQYRDGIVTIADITGLSVAVHIVNGKYGLELKHRREYYDEPKDVMEGVIKAIGVIKRRRKRQGY